MLDKIEVLKDNGEKILYDEISMFEVSISLNPKRYAVLTSNELDPNGLIKLLVAEISGDRLIKITDDTEWATIKNVMRSVISNSSYDFNYINVDNKFSTTGDVFRVIAVQESAKMQLISDYTAKKPNKEVKSEPPKETKTYDQPVIDPSIYPAVDTNSNAGAEIIPGIMETNSDLYSNVTNIEPQEQVSVQVPSDNIVNDIPGADTPVITIPAQPPTPEQVVNSSVTPVENPVVTDVNTNLEVTNQVPSEAVKVINDEIKDSNESDIARKELIDTIVNAIDKYVSQIKTGNNDSQEVERLKQELKAMEAKLNNIMSLIKQ